MRGLRGEGSYLKMVIMSSGPFRKTIEMARDTSEPRGEIRSRIARVMSRTERGISERSERKRDGDRRASEGMWTAGRNNYRKLASKPGSVLRILVRLLCRTFLPPLSTPPYPSHPPFTPPLLASANEHARSCARGTFRDVLAT